MGGDVTRAAATLGLPAWGGHAGIPSLIHLIPQLWCFYRGLSSSPSVARALWSRSVVLAAVTLQGRI